LYAAAYVPQSFLLDPILESWKVEIAHGPQHTQAEYLRAPYLWVGSQLTDKCKNSQKKFATTDAFSQLVAMNK
jgi:hypothetical protein